MVHYKKLRHYYNQILLDIDREADQTGNGPIALAIPALATTLTIAVAENPGQPAVAHGHVGILLVIIKPYILLLEVLAIRRQ